MREFLIAVLLFASVILSVTAKLQHDQLAADETRMKTMENRQHELEEKTDHFVNFRVDMKDLDVRIDRLQELIKEGEAPLPNAPDATALPNGAQVSTP